MWFGPGTQRPTWQRSRPWQRSTREYRRYVRSHKRDGVHYGCGEGTAKADMRALIASNRNDGEFVQRIWPTISQRKPIKLIEARAMTKATWQLENDRCRKIGELINSPYFMTFEDFRAILLPAPALSRFPFVGEASELPDELVTLPWHASAEHTRFFQPLLSESKPASAEDNMSVQCERRVL